MRVHPIRLVPLALVLVALLAPGCGTSPASPEFVEETVLTGFLFVGEAVTPANALLLTRTRPVDQPYDPEEAAIQGAIVLLRASGAPAADTLHMVAPGRYANAAVTVAPNTTYQLSVQAGARTLSATTITPSALTLVSAPLELPGTMSYDAIPEQYPIVVDGSDPQEILLVDTYCHESYTDARYVNPIGTHESPDDEQEYGGANGAPRHTQFFFRLGDLAAAPGGHRIGFYGDMMSFFGEHTVGVFAIDANYYNHLYRDHPESNGAVVGGIGVFGSAWRRTFRVKTVP